MASRSSADRRSPNPPEQFSWALVLGGCIAIAVVIIMILAAYLSSVRRFRPKRGEPAPTDQPGWIRLLHGRRRAYGVTALTFSEDSKRLASGDPLGVVNFWDPAEGRPIKTLNEHKQGVFAKAMAFDPSGRLFCSGDYGGKIFLYETRGFRRLACLDGHPGVVDALAFSRDGRMLVSANHHCGRMKATVRLWDLGSQRAIASFELDETIFGFELVAVTPEGRVIAVEERGKVDLLDGHDLALLKQQACDATPMYAAGLVPGARAIVTVNAAPDRSDSRNLLPPDENVVRVWDTSTLSLILEARPGPRQIYRVASTADLSTLAFAMDDFGQEDGLVLLYETRTRLARRRVLHARNILSLAISPDGKTLAAGCIDGLVVLSPVDSPGD